MIPLNKWIKILIQEELEKKKNEVVPVAGKKTEQTGLELKPIAKPEQKEEIEKRKKEGHETI